MSVELSTIKLPINLINLLQQRTIESERVEYKAGWNPERVIHTLSAFANDFHNLGGGYAVVGEIKENSCKITHLKVLVVPFIGLLQFLSYNQRQLRGIFNG